MQRECGAIYARVFAHTRKKAEIEWFRWYWWDSERGSVLRVVIVWSSLDLCVRFRRMCTQRYRIATKRKSMSSSNESVRLSAFPSAGLCSFLYINRLSGRALGMKYVTPPSSSVWSPFWSIHQDPLLCSARLPRVWPPSLCWCFECSPTLFCVPFEHFMPYRFLVVVVARPAATCYDDALPAKALKKRCDFFIARDLFGFFSSCFLPLSTRLSLLSPSLGAA